MEKRTPPPVPPRQGSTVAVVSPAELPLAPQQQQQQRQQRQHEEPDTPVSEEARPDRLMTTSYSEICQGGSSGRSSVVDGGSDTLLSPDLSPVSPDRQPDELVTDAPATPSAAAPQSASGNCDVSARPSAALLDELEQDARRLAASADGLIESLTGTMYSISSLAVDAMDAHRDAVCKTCDGVDANIKAMYQVMAKTEELNKTVKQVHPLAGQIRELKRLLDLFESAVIAGS